MDAGERDDAALLRDAGAGDARSMRRLFDRHGGRIYGLALRLTGRRDDADDATQETFVRAWTHGATFRGEASLGTWLCRIAVNVCRELYRKEQRGERWRVGDAGHVGAQSGTPRDVPLALRLEAGLGALPEGYREVLVMHDVLGMDHSEIATVLGVEVGTSKSQLHKARARMRESLGRAG
jgi:RNA polymerase sigma-70 factor (ECF subfamily)